MDPHYKVPPLLDRRACSEKTADLVEKSGLAFEDGPDGDRLPGQNVEGVNQEPSRDVSEEVAPFAVLPRREEVEDDIDDVKGVQRNSEDAAQVQGMEAKRRSYRRQLRFRRAIVLGHAHEAAIKRALVRLVNAKENCEGLPDDPQWMARCEGREGVRAGRMSVGGIDIRGGGAVRFRFWQRTVEFGGGGKPDDLVSGRISSGHGRFAE